MNASHHSCADYCRITCANTSKTPSFRKKSFLSFDRSYPKLSRYIKSPSLVPNKVLTTVGTPEDAIVYQTEFRAESVHKRIISHTKTAELKLKDEFEVDDIEPAVEFAADFEKSGDLTEA